MWWAEVMLQGVPWMGIGKMLKLSCQLCASQLQGEKGICFHVAVSWVALNLEWRRVTSRQTVLDVLPLVNHWYILEQEINMGRTLSPRQRGISKTPRQRSARGGGMRVWPRGLGPTASWRGEQLSVNGLGIRHPQGSRLQCSVTLESTNSSGWEHRPRMQGTALTSGYRPRVAKHLAWRQARDPPLLSRIPSFENIILVRQYMWGLGTVQHHQCVISVSWDSGSQAPSACVSEARSHGSALC